ncbi:MAG TPA: alanine racemase, partial [Propionicimonas sp.]|nr:alanine racemase [Propionicimonas sp.]
MMDEILGLAAEDVASPAVRGTARATVNLDVISRNVEVLREHAGSAAVMAVVKADAY